MFSLLIVIFRIRVAWLFERKKERELTVSWSLSSDVFKRRTLTGSEPFSLLKYLDATKFACLSFFALIETICKNNCSQSRLKSVTCPLPDDVRRSQTSLLKFSVVVFRSAE